MMPEEETLPAQTAETKEAQPMGGTGLTLLICAAAAAVGWTFLHWKGEFFFSDHLPGIGLTVTQWALLSAALICAQVKGTLRWTRGGSLCLILSILLGTCFALFANDGLRAMNLPVTVLLSAQAVFSLTGQIAHPPLTAAGLWDGFRLLFRTPLRHWGVPFRALSLKRKNKVGWYPVLMGLLAAIPITAVAVTLMCSADALFESLWIEGAHAIGGLDGRFLMRLIIAFFLSLALFSFLFSAVLPPKALSPARAPSLQPLAIAVVLAVLALLYAVFAYIQVRYLFGGVSSVRMSGGYAAYARSGFFQLVALAGLTLALILPALALWRDARAVRALCALVAALTIVINASAFFRMRLYMDAYGLSTLRLLTLWAMAMILLALIAAIVKSVRPALRICPLLAAVALGSWIALNLCNVDRIVCRNQVRRFNEGTGDWNAIVSLRESCTPDYLPALAEIRDPQKREEAIQQFTSDLLYDADRRLAYDWSLCQTLMPKVEKH